MEAVAEARRWASNVRQHTAIASTTTDAAHVAN